MYLALNKDVKPPTKNSMSSVLVEEYLGMEAMVKEILKKNESLISFTIDGWSAKNLCSYYGVTASFINNDWNLIAFAIDLVPSRGEHSGKKK